MYRMSRRLRPVRALLLFLVLACPGRARCDAQQDEHVANLEQRLAALEAEMAEIRAELTALRHAPAPETSTAPAGTLLPAVGTSLETSGFLHVHADPLHADESPFALGSFEYDITATISDNIGTSGALVFEPDGTTLGIGFVDVHFGGRGVGPRGRIFSDPGFHVQVGRFDIPFGLDYRNFAAPDRVTISAPLLTDGLFEGGLNSEGVRVYARRKFVDLSFFTTRSLASDTGLTYGGRIGWSPGRNPYSLHHRGWHDLTLGISYAGNYGRDWVSYGHFIGTDIEFVLKRLTVTGEWAERKDLVGRRQAYYLLTVLRAGTIHGVPLTGFARFDRGDLHQQLITCGLNLRFTEQTIMKAETGHYMSFGDLDPEARELGRTRLNLQWVIIF